VNFFRVSIVTSSSPPLNASNNHPKPADDKAVRTNLIGKDHDFKVLILSVS